MRQRLLIGILLAVALALVAALVIIPRLNRPVTLSGYVEGEPLYLASPISGTVTGMTVQRGDRVSAGQHLYVIDPRQLAAQKTQAAEAVVTAQAQAEDARKGQRPAELAVFDANIAAAEARARDARALLRRTTILAAKGFDSQARLDDARAAHDAAVAQVAAARRQREAAALGARQDQVRAADSRVREAQAGLVAADARLTDISPAAPGAGRVEDTFFQTGEWAAANQPILSLIPDDRIRIRFFTPERTVAAYASGRTVRFTCDGCAAEMTAVITYVSPRPEFTPPIIYSREARDRLVYLIEARPSVRLNPGQPVDVSPLGGER
jgi:HlyD family secretion protein